MIKKIFILLFLASCSTQSLKMNSDISSFNFDTYLSFNEFKKKLIEYIKIAPYPDINE
tara:strand:- start:2447 stop:2620 length:174 start_codon:yes stop_codon:yes gene_type:complete